MSEVPAIERKIRHRFFVDHLTDRGRCGFKQWRSGTDFDRLADAADLKREVDARRLVDLKTDGLPRDLLEPLLLRGETIGAGCRSGNW